METVPDPDPRVRILVAMLADVPWGTLVDTLGITAAQQMVEQTQDELAAMRRRKQEAA